MSLKAQRGDRESFCRNA